MILNQIIDNYKIVSLLGKGGMASVYLAENSQKKPQKVAIKILELDIEENAEYVLRFKKETFIGRGEINNIILKDSHASRKHVKITILNGNYIIEDLKSTNGTYVNGGKISMHYLNNGDKIKICNNLFIFNC